MLVFRQLPSSLSRSFTISLRAFTSAPILEPSVPLPPKLTTKSSTPKKPEHASTVTPMLIEGRQRRKRIPPKRPSISLESPRAWNRPLKKGVVPAYDLALATLIKDSQLLKAEAKQMRHDLSKKEANYQKLKAKLESLPNESVSEDRRNFLNEEMQTLDDELEKILEKLHIIQVQSEVNLPDVRWKVNNAMGALFLCPTFYFAYSI
jgi:large subunit ribosomal protein L35